ncbi:MAG: ArsR family transcriptional regulator [Calditrichaeota bacterium]|nr:MAG: ArsR family transcriptional regulator [Calditrichota bacterium]
MNDQCCQIFHALGDKTRLKILELLKEKEICVTDICTHFDMTQPSISHHLDILKRAGLVSSEKRGREVYYTFKKDILVECCGKQFSVFDLALKPK